MRNDQKRRAQTSIRIAQEELQQIASGCRNERTLDLSERREQADWQMCYLLRNLIETLPQNIGAQVQACSDLRNHLWSEEYRRTYYAAQEKASPSCLQASDSL